MMVVGSTLTHYDKVTGIVYAKRSNRSDRLSLWLTTNDREICRQSETEWLELLQKINTEGFNIGSTSFTNHKGSGHHHRTNERGNERGGDREYRGDRGGDREHRGDREYRGDRDNREHRGDRDQRDNRDNRGDRRPNKFPSRGGGSSGFGGPRQSSESAPRSTENWNRK